MLADCEEEAAVGSESIRHLYGGADFEQSLVGGFSVIDMTVQELPSHEEPSEDMIAAWQAECGGAGPEVGEYLINPGNVGPLIAGPNNRSTT